ncbi:hypothetical protein SteCoe_9658 [Stentor coeruleus]|uniref:Uncharacterized protein n=1 Tax=Stentor coeruleus TaxID=5963 RepID=A0A1R2CHA7_9CILI|nr:hypothetical protein SteCoe_9658 [Stentor coeruleus]
MEDQLEFGKSLSANIDFIIRKYSTEWDINDDQFGQIVDELELKVKKCPQCPKIEAFYEMYKTSEGKYNGRDLVVAGIICGNAQAITKARLLFELYDRQLSFKINREDFESIFDDLYRFCIERAPLLVSNSTMPIATQGQIIQYISDLDLNKKKAREKFVEKLMNSKETIMKNEFIELFDELENAKLMNSKETIMKNEFIELFDELENAKLLCSFGFRKFIGSCKE